MNSREREARSQREHAPLLVGRERERALLRECLDAALAGRGGLVLIGGEAGIGKTALCEALAAEAVEQDALVLVGRCYDLSETPPYGPWLEAFARYPATGDLPPLPEPLAERGQLGPVVSRDALFSQVRDFLAAVAAVRPLVLVLDDLHWADPASLDLLRFAARGLADAPLLLLAAYRSDELPAGHPLAALVPRLVREAAAERLNLAPLDEAAVRALVAARYPLAEPDLARLATYLQGRAEGNPFYLDELLRSLAEGGLLRRAAGSGWALGDLAAAPVPPLLRQVIKERVTRLGDEAARLLALAAVIGQAVPLAVWQVVGDVAEGALLDVVERAVEAHLLAAAPDGVGVRFVHALVREALYAGVLPPRRRDWHRRVAEALAVWPDPDPDAVAYHFQQAGAPRAAEWLIAAGDRAFRVAAERTAAARYAAALALIQGAGADARQLGWLHLRVARAGFKVDPHQGMASLAEAARLGTATGDQALVAYARYWLGFHRSGIGDYGRGLSEMAEGLAALEGLTPAEWTPLTALARHGAARHELEVLRGTLADRLSLAGRCDEACTLAAQALAAAGDIGNAHAALVKVSAIRGRADAARAASARCRDAWRAEGNDFSVGVYTFLDLYTVVIPYWTDHLEERRRLAVEAERAFARADAAQADAPPRLAHLPLLWLEGQWAEARALALALRATSRTYRPLAAIVLGPLARAQGDTALAWALVGEWLPAGLAEEPGDRYYLNALVMLRLAATLATDADDPPTARSWLAAHDRWLAWAGATLGRAEGELGWAAYYRASGDLARAQAHAEQALARAAEPRQPLALLAAHRALGELATAAGDRDEAAAHLDEALALADACAAPYERALTLLALAELRAATGEREAAGAALTEARTILERLAARPALARADALAAGLALVRPPRPGYPAGLTPREVEVLRLVAAGGSNREVAAALCLSVRTVERHITNLYGKIDARGRADATAFAFRHHLT